MKATSIFVTYAKYNRDANKAVCGLLDKLSNDEREKDRGSYYKSLTGALRHVVGSLTHFVGMMAAAIGGNDKAQQAAKTIDGIAIPGEGALNADQWKKLVAAFKTVDDAFVKFCEALSDSDLDAQVKWFSGDMVGIHFMLSQLMAHGTHHRGQISQMLDEMKIEHNFSGIAPANF
jgi:uncharacterized damage-inducible protein DinB